MVGRRDYRSRHPKDPAPLATLGSLADTPEIMTEPHSPRSPQGTMHKTDLNLSRVAAAALAAVTAAVLGSSLGAEGTLIGAAAASVVTTVATAIYQASLERSRERVRSLAHRARPVASPQEGSAIEPSHPAATEARPSDHRLTDDADPPQQHGSRSRRFGKLGWGAVVVGALVGFGLAMIMITGFEWVSGQTVGGNGQGTTIGQVVTDRSGSQAPTRPPASHDGPAGPVQGTPTETPTETPDTSVTNPDGRARGEHSRTTTRSPSPTEVTTTPPLLPRLPGISP